MLNPGRNKRRDNQLKWLEAIDKYCLVAFFCISFLGQYPAALFLSHSPDNKLSEGKSLVCDGSRAGLDLPLTFLFGIEPDDNDAVKDDPIANREHGSWLLDSLPANDSRYCIEKASFLNFISSIENRRPVSLIILHHCWKSFLC